jgi:putative transposase
MSTHTYQFACHLPQAIADALNAESARIYNAVMVEHWRIYRKKGIWLRRGTAEKLNDFYDTEIPKLLHSHSIDAAQQAFYKACKTTLTLRKNGDEQARYPYKQRRYRTTVWKSTGVYQVSNGMLYLSRAAGLERLQVSLPSHLAQLEEQQIAEVRLVFNKATFHYIWHVVVDEGIGIEAEGAKIAGVDLGEIHPVALTDGVEAVVIACRELRALNQGRNKRVAAIDAKLAKYRKHSRRWRKLKKRKRRYLAQVQQQKHDMEHKIARETVSWAQENKIGVLAIGDVRDIADGKRWNTQNQQKLSNWSHGTIRQYITYKAADVGISVVDDVSEKYTSQTCPNCRKRHKPKGRRFKCPYCGSLLHRDVVGAANIASRYEYAELGRYPAPEPKYRYPVLQGKRSLTGTGEMAR